MSAGSIPAAKTTQPALTPGKNHARDDQLTQVKFRCSTKSRNYSFCERCVKPPRRRLKRGQRSRKTKTVNRCSSKSTALAYSRILIEKESRNGSHHRFSRDCHCDCRSAEPPLIRGKRGACPPSVLSFLPLVEQTHDQIDEQQGKYGLASEYDYKDVLHVFFLHVIDGPKFFVRASTPLPVADTYTLKRRFSPTGCR